MPKLATVPRLWPAGTVAVCVAAGPSLTQADVDYVRGRAKVIVVNRSLEIAPWADVWYACDARFFKWVAQGQGDFRNLKEIAAQYQGPTYSLALESKRWRPGVKVLSKGTTHGLSLNPAKLCLGGNGGYQALNLAVLLGATRILLLGYDMGVDAKGRQHWHADHPNKMRSPYQTFLQGFPTLVEPLKKAGIEVVNCTLESRLKCWPKMSIQDTLPLVEAKVIHHNFDNGLDITINGRTEHVA